MPFTFSHPALVLPLRKLPTHWFSMTGLILGSMLPDFEYFFRLAIRSEYSHTLAGLFWFNLPIGVLLAFIFHHAVKKTLFKNLPAFFQARFNRYLSFNWKSYFMQHPFVVLFSLLIGASSHLFWDGFTHPTGYFVEHIPLLQGTVTLWGKPFLLSKLLQHISSGLGAVFILAVIGKLPATSTTFSIRWSYWFTLFLLSLFLVAVRLLSGLPLTAYGHLVATCIGALLYALLVMALCQLVRQTFKR